MAPTAITVPGDNCTSITNSTTTATPSWLCSYDGVNGTTSALATISTTITDNATTTPTTTTELEGLLSDQAAYVIQTAVEVGVLPWLVLGGIAMNVVNMVVFYRQGLSDRINLCLFSLALSDTGYISFLLSTRLYSLFSLIHPPLGQFWRVRSLNLIGLYAGFLNTSNCLTLLISLERCFLVISPLKARSLLSVRHMAVLIVTAFLVCLSCSGIFVFKYDTGSFTDPLTNATVYRRLLTPFYQANSQAVEFVFQTFNIVVPTTALVVVMAATSVIVVRMRDVSAWRQQNANVTSSAATADRSETSLTRMLVVVCVVFTVCSMPAVVRPFVALVVDGFQPAMRYQNSMYTSVSLMHMMTSINCSLNFLIYCRMSTRFRATLRGLCGCLAGRGKAQKGLEPSTVMSTAGY